ncbi:MAG: hypothetical protein IJ523_08955 [Succinivibrionaceae bacterium]|nr:hypothetical protein [Succinivibrionaceae bacterium]
MKSGSRMLFLASVLALGSGSLRALPLEWEMVLTDPLPEGQTERDSYVFRRVDSDETVTVKLIPASKDTQPSQLLEELARTAGCSLGEVASMESAGAGIDARYCGGPEAVNEYLLVVKTGAEHSLLITGHHSTYRSVDELMKRLTYVPPAAP